MGELDAYVCVLYLSIRSWRGHVSMHTSGCTDGIGSLAAMEEMMEMVSAEEMLCGPTNTASCNSTLLDKDSSRTGHNKLKLIVSRTSTHENIAIKK